MIYCLIGKSASGKSTIEKKLHDKNVAIKIVSHTTRPPRIGEHDGYDYHFVTDTQFDLLKDEGHFNETAKYRDWNYGMSLKDVNYKEYPYIAVVTMDGYQEIMESVGRENVKGIYIHTDESERLIRQLNRGDDTDEVIRRYNTDKYDFMHADIKLNQIVINDDIEKSANEIEKYIKYWESKAK